MLNGVNVLTIVRQSISVWLWCLQSGILWIFHSVANLAISTFFGLLWDKERCQRKLEGPGKKVWSAKYRRDQRSWSGFHWTHSQISIDFCAWRFKLKAHKSFAAPPVFFTWVAATVLLTWEASEEFQSRLSPCSAHTCSAHTLPQLGNYVSQETMCRCITLKTSMAFNWPDF